MSLSRDSDGHTYIEYIIGETPEMSEYVLCEFYYWVVFRQNWGVGESELGRWIGVSHQVGPLMTYYILPKSSIPISCGTVQRLTLLEQ